jgi:hypothetical protein
MSSRPRCFLTLTMNFLPRRSEVSSSSRGLVPWFLPTGLWLASANVLRHVLVFSSHTTYHYATINTHSSVIGHSSSITFVSKNQIQVVFVHTTYHIRGSTRTTDLFISSNIHTHPRTRISSHGPQRQFKSPHAPTARCSRKKRSCLPWRAGVSSLGKTMKRKWSPP